MESDEIAPPLNEGKKSKSKVFRWFFGVLILGIVWLLFFSNLEFLRQPISNALSKATGLDVQFESISISKSLRIQLQQVKVKTKGGADDLFSSEKVLLNLEWKPLLNGEIKIINTAIIQPVLKIAMNPSSTKSASLPQLGKIIKARFAPNELNAPFTPLRVKATPSSSHIDRWKALQSALRDVYLDIDALEIDRGKIILTLDENGQLIEVPISISANLSLQRSSLEKLDLKTQLFEISSDALLVNGQLEIVDMLSSSTEIHLRAVSDDFKVNQLQEISPILSPSMQKFIVKNADGSAKKINLVMTIAPTNKNESFLNGSLGIENLTWPGEKSAVTIKEIRTLFKAPSPELATAQTKADQIAVDKILFKSFKADIQWEDDRLDIKNGMLTPLHGNLNFSGLVHSKMSRYDFDFASEELQIEDFLDDKAKGPVKISGKLHGTLPQSSNQNRGDFQPAVHSIFKEMNGNAKVELNDGKFPSLELMGAFIHFIDPNEETDLLRRGLVYQKMGGDFQMTQGIVKTTNFALKGKRVNVQARGKINLPSQTIQAQVRGLPLKLLEQVAGPLPMELVPLLGKSGLKEAVYLKVEGPLQYPRMILTADPNAISNPAQLLRGILDMAFPGQ